MRTPAQIADSTLTTNGLVEMGIDCSSEIPDRLHHPVPVVGPGITLEYVRTIG